MGSSTQKTTTTSGPSNPAVNSLVTKLSSNLADLYTPGQNLYTAPGANTTAGWDSSLAAANNPAYASSINGAIQNFGDVAAGKMFGTNDPGYATLRNNVMNDTLAATNKAFNSSGLFGSDSNQKAAGEGVANALAGLDYQNYQSDIARQQAAVPILSQLFSSAQLPSSVQQSVGASQDQAAQGAANGQLDTLSKYIAAMTGAANAGGTTQTTSTPTTPLWQSLLGLGISLL